MRVVSDQINEARRKGGNAPIEDDDDDDENDDELDENDKKAMEELEKSE